jgi:hypothetical protein
MVPSMPAVPVMHEEMAQRAEQENKVWQHSEEVSTMLGPEKERRGDQEQGDYSPVSETVGPFSIVA